MHTVLVVDTGFDPSLDVLKNKVVAQYTLTCDSSSTDLAAATDFATAKANALSKLSTADQSCKLTEGIAPNISTGFDQFQASRDGWNLFTLSKGTDRSGLLPSLLSSLDVFNKVLRGEDLGTEYHGTWVASTIAYQNPQVKLVLVHDNTIGTGNGNTGTADATCTTAADAAIVNQLYTDPDIVTAAVNAPISSREQALADLVTKHQVTLINESFGSTTLATVNKANADKGCPAIDISAYYKGYGNIQAKRQVALLQKLPAMQGALVVQSAGNDGSQADTLADSLQCSNPGGNVLYIGALTAKREISSYSNHGACVDAYALGDHVIASSPRNFLDAVSGTSFSAPLVVRYLSLTAPASASVKDMTDLIHSHSDSNRFLEASAMPSTISYDDKTALSGFNLDSLSTSDPLSTLHHAYKRDGFMQMP